MKKLSGFSDLAYAMLRFMCGWMFAFHGMQKILGVWSDFHAVPGTQMWFGGLIELIGGSLIALGLFARPAAFLCSGTMAVAYAQFHWKLQTGRAFFPAINQGELAVVYCFVFFLVACRGSGRWALRPD